MKKTRLLRYISRVLIAGIGLSLLAPSTRTDAECPDGSCGGWTGAGGRIGGAVDIYCDGSTMKARVTDGKEKCLYVDPCEGCTNDPRTYDVQYTCVVFGPIEDPNDPSRIYYEAVCTASSSCGNVLQLTRIKEYVNSCPACQP